jgi:toxin YoeB
VKKIWFDEAWEDYLYWQTQDKKTIKRINALLKDIERGSFDGIGKPEPLKGDLRGFWSRRIDDVNRFVLPSTRRDVRNPFMSWTLRRFSMTTYKTSRAVLLCSGRALTNPRHHLHAYCLTLFYIWLKNPATACMTASASRSPLYRR